MGTRPKRSRRQGMVGEPRLGFAKRLAAWLNQSDPLLTAGQQQTGAAIEILKARKPGTGSALLKIYGHIHVQLGLIEDLTEDLRGIPEGVAPMIIEQTPSDHGLRLLSDVTTAGALGALRQCSHCKKWFATQRSDKSFCTADCRESWWEEYRRTEEGRQGEAARKAEYRNRLKEQEAKPKGRKRR